MEYLPKWKTKPEKFINFIAIHNQIYNPNKTSLLKILQIVLIKNILLNI